MQRKQIFFLSSNSLFSFIWDLAGILLNTFHCALFFWNGLMAPDSRISATYCLSQCPVLVLDGNVDELHFFFRFSGSSVKIWMETWLVRWWLYMCVHRWNSCLWSNPTCGQYKITTTNRSMKHLTTSLSQRRIIRWECCCILLNTYISCHRVIIPWFNILCFPPTLVFRHWGHQ